MNFVPFEGDPTHLLGEKKPATVLSDRVTAGLLEKRFWSKTLFDEEQHIRSAAHRN